MRNYILYPVTNHNGEEKKKKLSNIELFQSGFFHFGACQVALVVKNPPASAGNAGDMDLIPGSGRYPGVENICI